MLRGIGFGVQGLRFKVQGSRSRDGSRQALGTDETRIGTDRSIGHVSFAFIRGSFCSASILFWRRRSLCLRLVFHAEQVGGFGAEAEELGVLGLVFVHPLDGLVVPLAGFFLVAELPVGHGEEEEVVAVTAFAKFNRLL